MMDYNFREVPRIGDKFVVTEDIPVKYSWERGAVKDEILTVDNWGGFPCLMYNDIPICDYNSTIHKKHCKAL
jgi:hypothetical protein